MASATLVEFDVEAGAELLRQMEGSEVEVRAALWLYFSEAEEWRLVLGTPLVAQIGSRAVYSKIQKILDQSGLGDRLLLMSITVMSMDEPLLKALRDMIHVDGIGGVRFSRNSINNLYIEDAYIYRMT